MVIERDGDKLTVSHNFTFTSIVKNLNLNNLTSGLRTLVLLIYFRQSRQFLIEKFFHLSSHSIRNGCDGEKIENNGGNSGPLMS